MSSTTGIRKTWEQSLLIYCKINRIDRRAFYRWPRALGIIEVFRERGDGHLSAAEADERPSMVKRGQCYQLFTEHLLRTGPWAKCTFE